MWLTSIVCYLLAGFPTFSLFIFSHGKIIALNDYVYNNTESSPLTIHSVMAKPILAPPSLAIFPFPDLL